LINRLEPEITFGKCGNFLNFLQHITGVKGLKKDQKCKDRKHPFGSIIHLIHGYNIGAAKLGKRDICYLESLEIDPGQKALEK
jgi:hypothetical protein